jgi:hypothetical protein
MSTETTKAEVIPTTSSATQLDPDKAQQFVGKVVTDCAATVSVALAVIGDQPGLYRAEPLPSCAQDPTQPCL